MENGDSPGVLEADPLTRTRAVKMAWSLRLEFSDFASAALVPSCCASFQLLLFLQGLVSSKGFGFGSGFKSQLDSNEDITYTSQNV